MNTNPAIRSNMKEIGTYILAHKFQTFIVAAILIFASMYLFPSPYNTRYAFNRTFRNPTAVCRDDIYSFSASRSGSCSNHGGVKKILPREK